MEDAKRFRDDVLKKYIKLGMLQAKREKKGVANTVEQQAEEGGGGYSATAACGGVVGREAGEHEEEARGGGGGFAASGCYSDADGKRQEQNQCRPESFETFD